MRRFFYVCTLILLLPIIRIYANEGVRIIKNTPETIVISYKPEFCGLEEISSLSDGAFILPKVNGEILNSSDYGAFSRIGISEIISVPSENGFSISNIEIKGSRKIKCKLSPIATPDWDNPPNTITKVNPEKYYSIEKTKFAEIKYLGIGQNRFLANLIIDAYLFNAHSGEITVASEIIITIKLDKSIKTELLTKNAVSTSFLNSGTVSDYIIKADELIRNNKKHISLQADNEKWLRIPISEDGIYRITASQLSAIGFNINASEVKSIKIFGNSGAELSEKVSDAAKYAMNEQAIIVNTNTDGSLKEIIFFGSGTKGFKYNDETMRFVHFQNVYSDKNYYLLTYGGDDGLRASYKAEPTNTPTYYPTTYIHRLYKDEDLYNPFPKGGGRIWFGEPFSSLQFINQLYNLDRSGIIFYKFNFGHKSSRSTRVNCYEGSKNLGYVSVSSINTDYNFASFNEGTYMANASDIGSDDRSYLRFDYQAPSGDLSSVCYFNFYELHYPRYFVPINNELTFDIDTFSLKKGNSGEFSINGYSDNIYGFDISNRNTPLLLKNLSSTGGLFKFRDTISNNSAYNQYYISSILKNVTLENYEVSNLMAETDGADIIFIYNESMQKTAEKYKEYREKERGLKVFLAKTKDIYTEFSSCKEDPTALRDLVSYAYKNWNKKPRFVVLWGDGHYDYRNKSIKSVNLVPTYQIEITTSSAHENNIFPTDDYFANVYGEDKVPDVAIGRLPVDNLETSEVVFQKIKDFELNSDKGLWQTQMLLLADDSNNEEGNEHDVYVEDSEELINESIPSYILTNKMYHAIYPTERISSIERRKPSLNKAWTTEVNTSGVSIINWLGHGNPRVWSHEEILDRDITLPSLINYKKLFFCTAGTCEYGRFDDPNIRSGAEVMVLSPTGGAIGIISATRISYESDNLSLIKSFYNKLFKIKDNGEYPTYGEALQFTKFTNYSSNDKKYCLLGDPTVQPKFPQFELELTKIGDTQINKDSVYKFKALEKIRLTGIVQNSSDSSVLKDFNGTGIITMFDGDEKTIVTDDDNETYPYLAYGGALNKSSFEVSNGEFIIEFVIPKDISYSSNQGRIYLSAFEREGVRSGKGFFNKFIINGTAENSSNDTQGPTAELYLDSRDFTRGDIVSSAPLLIVDLYDESGINTTGLGIGHKIDLWIDDNPLSIDMTKKFTTSLADSRRGTIEDILTNLGAGKHKIKLRVWDIYNNFTTVETDFLIKDPELPAEILNILNYPNPFSDITTISFEHTAVPPYDVKVVIYNVAGEVVNVIEATKTQIRRAEINWDGKDNYGNSLPRGAYYYKVYLTEKSKVSEAYGKMYLVK